MRLNNYLLYFVLMSLAVMQSTFASTEKPPEVLIAYFSPHGTTKQLAEQISAGAKKIPHTKVILKEVSAVRLQDIENAKALIIGCPVYYANIPKQFLDFFNNWKISNARLKNKVAAVFDTGGGDAAGRESVLFSLMRPLFLYQDIIVGGVDWRSAFGVSAQSSFDATKTFSEHKINRILSANNLKQAYALGLRVSKLTHRLSD